MGEAGQLLFGILDFLFLLVNFQCKIFELLFWRDDSILPESITKVSLFCLVVLIDILILP